MSVSALICEALNQGPKTKEELCEYVISRRNNNTKRISVVKGIGELRRNGNIKQVGEKIEIVISPCIRKRKPLDDTSESNKILRLDDPEEIKEEMKHIRFAPTFLCDFELIYQDTVFHLHRVLLAKYCLYFKALFEEKPSLKKITLPIQKDVNGNIIDPEELDSFFECIYNATIFGVTRTCPADDFFWTAVDAKHCKYSLFVFYHFTSYFQMEAVLNSLDAMMMGEIGAYDNTALVILELAIVYNRNATRDRCIDWIGRHLDHVRSHRDYSVQKWEAIPIAVREKILEKALSIVNTTV